MSAAGAGGKSSGTARLAVVTGASGGIGAALTTLLAERGIALVLLERDRQKAEAFAAAVNRRTPGAVREVFAADLANHDDLRRVGAAIVASHPAIDYLFNNAGVLTETLQMSPSGNELHFEVNTLAPLQLIDHLRPALARARGATVVSTSAGIADRATTLDWDELVRPREFSKLFGPYVRSKQALNVLTAALAPELGADGIAIRTADPGPTRTRLTKGAGTPWWMRLFAWALPSPAKSARKILDAALSPTWQGRSGISISNGKVQVLPPALADPGFQATLLRQCRARVASPG